MGHRQTHMTLVNGVETSALSIADRGLAYGDGLFETMRVIGGQVPLLEWHVRRFVQGVRMLELGSRSRLGLGFRQRVKTIAAEFQGAVSIKYMLTRGTQGTGYQPPLHPDLTEIIQVSSLPDWPDTYYTQGVRVRICRHRLPVRVALPGIKHLNRLDQVMAAHELTGEQEGLLFDFEERLIEGTRSNVLLLEQGKWVTPDLEQVGVKGTLRQFLLELGAPLDLREAHISHQRLLAADAIFMVNGLFGVWPVCELDGQVRVVPPAASEALRQQVQTVLGYPQGLEVSRPPQIV